MRVESWNEKKFPMDDPEDFVAQQAEGYARMLLAFVPGLVLFLAVLSGAFAALFIRKEVSLGLPREPLVFAIISALALALMQLLLVALKRFLAKVKETLPVGPNTLRLLCVLSFSFGISLGFKV